jgi:hypothetical protein
LDSSGSVGGGNFQTVKEYAYNFTESLLGGNHDSRVGVIVYSSTARVVIELEARGQQMLLGEIRNLTYTAGNTNTPEALCLLKSRPWRNDISVLRIAVVLTDGRSNRESTTCVQDDGTPGTLNSTAEEIHSFDPPVTVFAVGVSNYVLGELKAIASDILLVDELASFDYRLLAQSQQSQSYFICFEGKCNIIWHRIHKVNK